MRKLQNTLNMNDAKVKKMMNTVSLLKLVTLNVVLMITLMLEFINDEWFFLSDYIMFYINDSQFLHMLNISLTC